jgi:hypothetical protein
MNKKKAILVVFVLLLISGGVFLWQKEEKIKGEPDDYVVESEGEEVIIRNEKAGFSIKVPEGWEVEKIGVEEGSVVLYSPDAEGVREGRIMPPLKNGCMIEMSVLYGDMTLEEVREEIEEVLSSKSLGNIEYNRFEEAKVKERKALKSYFNSTDLGFNFDIYIKDNQILYGIGATIATSTIESCLNEIDIILEGISFK